MPPVIPARRAGECPVCKQHIAVGTNIIHRPAFGYVHHPKCMTAAPTLPATAALGASADSSDKWNDFDDEPESREPDAPEGGDEFSAEELEAMALEAAGVPAKKPAKKSEPSNSAELEAKLFAELKRATADQTRLVKAMVRDEMKGAYEAQLPELLKRITEATKVATTEIVRQKLDDANREFKQQTARAIAKIASSGFVRQEIVVTRPDGTKTEMAGEVFHPRFDWILKLASAGKPIFLPGPTGCGKTHTAMQVARALHGEAWQDKFGILSCSPATAERHFLGRSIPNITTGQDVYRAAEFVKIYENGGVFCADEIDAADASVLLVFNAALANGYLPVPDRTENPIARRHPDFVFIACANTWGRGADRRYVGRNPLDEATLDRFRIGTVPLNYSPAIERCKCPDTDLFDTLTGWRGKIMEHKLERVLSTRFFGDAYDMLTAGGALEDIRRAFFSGWRKEEVIKVLGHELDEE